MIKSFINNQQVSLQINEDENVHRFANQGKLLLREREREREREKERGRQTETKSMT